MAHVRYKPVKEKRLFGPERHYSEIDWDNFDKAVTHFMKSLQAWYLDPAETLNKMPHFGFAVMSLSCTLVDTLSQYYYGVEEGSRQNFIKFADDHFPGFSDKLSKTIKTSHQGKETEISTYSEALYHGFRCGIVHEAHVKLYTGIVGQEKLATCYETGFTLYDDGSDCPTVIIDPHRFLEHLNGVFKSYFTTLLDSDPKNDDARDKFKKKFKWSYGIDIGK